MTKPTATQLAILAAATARADGLVVRPPALKPAGAAKIAGKLLDQGLVRELRAKGDMPVWREDEHGKAFSLKILKAGRAAVQAMAPQAPTSQAAAPAAEDEELAPRGDMRGDDGTPATAVEPPTPAADTSSAKPGSKRAVVLALLSREGGATAEALMEATGWLPHTTRAALSGLRKGGLAIARSRDGEGRASVYKLEAATAAAAA